PWSNVRRLDFIHAASKRLAAQRPNDLLGSSNPEQAFASQAMPRIVGSEDSIWSGTNGVVKWQGLDFKDVDSGSSELPFRQCSGEGDGVNYGPSCGVNENGGGLHALQFPISYQSTGFIVERRVHRKDVGPLQNRMKIESLGSGRFEIGCGD